ncbi:hypothetical protein ABZ920_02860 [Streptomyces sp. NPDC046831]|uniref:hypothetical protein n=1 Tax=Streptomyces sp. NPDC046831 TaxID=3154805 RepID=UPI00340F8110
MPADNQHEDRPETAIEEVLREVEEAEKKHVDDSEDPRHAGEDGEAITTNTRAQEESQGE